MANKTIMQNPITIPIPPPLSAESAAVQNPESISIAKSPPVPLNTILRTDTVAVSDNTIMINAIGTAKTCVKEDASLNT